MRLLRRFVPRNDLILYQIRFNSHPKLTLTAVSLRTRQSLILN